MRTMRAAVLESIGQVVMREVPVPEPGPGEIVVRVDVALTCGTDLKTIRRGHPLIPMPTPLGHEFAGTVATVGAGLRSWHEGDEIAAVPTAPCLTCRPCRRGRESLCERAIDDMVFGAFAEFVRLPAPLVARNVYPRPEGLDPASAALLEPLACVVHGVARVDAIEPELTVLIGDGAIALLMLQLLVHRGASRVIVAGRHDNRLETARNLGAAFTLNTATATNSLADVVLEATSGAGADLVIECVGSPETWRTALSLAATGATVLMFGGCAAGTRVEFDPFRIHYQEIDVRGAFHYDRTAVRDAWTLLARRDIETGPLITHEQRLDSLPRALELAERREAIKVAVRP